MEKFFFLPAVFVLLGEVEEKAYVTYFVGFSMGNTAALSLSLIQHESEQSLLFFLGSIPCFKKNGSKAKSVNIVAKFFIFLLKLHRVRKIIVLILVCVLPKFMGSYSFTLYQLNVIIVRFHCVKLCMYVA